MVNIMVNIMLEICVICVIRVLKMASHTASRSACCVKLRMKRGNEVAI
jgi:hypothetical protein